MARHVSQSARPEIPPSAPLEGMVRGMIGPLGRRADPEVPIERLRNRRRPGGTIDSLRPDRTVGPHMDLTDDAERPGANELDDAAELGISVSLRDRKSVV